MNKQTLVLAALAVVAIAAGLAVGVRSFRPEAPTEIAGFVYPEPKAIAPFKLTQHDGSPFDAQALEGHWSFVYFGYTYCPDVCPTTLADLSRVQQALEAQGLDADNRYFFVSVDPKRDTPKRLGEYVVHFNKKFVGVTGETDALKQFTQPLGVGYAFPEGTSGDNYPVDHASLILLFGPDANLHAVFTSPHRPDAIVDGFRKIATN